MTWSATTEMEPAAVAGYRLSPQQRRLWRLRTAHGDAFRVQAVVRLGEGPASGAVVRALAGLVGEHEILRTAFRCPRGAEMPLQMVGNAGLQWEGELDLRGLSTARCRCEMERLLRDERRRPFDLIAGAVLRAFLVDSGGGRLLVLSLPALCGDRASAALLLTELLRRLRGAGGGGDTGAPPIQYADVAEWQNQLIEEAAGTAGTEPWSRHRADPEGHVLPFGVRPAAAAVFRPERVVASLDGGAAGRIAALAAGEGVAFQAVLLAAWGILLARLAGRTSVVIGMLCDGRGHAELAAAQGPLARFVPLPLELADGMSFRRLAATVDAGIAELVEWQELFDPATPAAEVPFRFEMHEPYAAAAVGVFACLDRFVVDLVCTRDERGLTLELYYDAAHLDEADAVCLARQVRAVLAAAVERPETTAGGLSLLGENEVRWLGEIGRGPAAAAPPPALCVHQLIAAQAARRPDALAVRCEDQALTYRELDAVSAALAAVIMDRGVATGDVVALCLDRSLVMVTAMLAVLKAGAAYLPADPALPRERLAGMCADASVALVVCRDETAAALPAGLPVLRMGDAVTRRPPAGAAGRRGRAVSAQDAAYVLFTSGSTGRPKGVVVEHRQLANYAAAVIERAGLAEVASFATVSTFAADLGNTVVFGALCSGGSLHVIADERLHDPDACAAYFREHRIECLKIVPSHLSALLTGADPTAVLPRRKLIFGGEALDWQLVEEVARLAPTCEIYNHYGPTETTVGATAGRVTPVGVRRTAGVPLGAPLDNVQVHLLDADLRLAPVGIPAELCIGGAGVARGYLAQPAATAESFAPDPFAGQAGARLYRTGDVARRLPSGALEFLGRRDHQIKIRGFRVELGEIEAVLRRHPAVYEAAVVAWPGTGGQPVLAAYLVPDPRRAAPVGRALALERAGALRTANLHELPNGMAVAHLNHNETDYLYREIFAERTYLRHGIGLRRGACVFDVGANIGAFALFAAQECGGDLRLFAFEPAPAACAALRLNVRLHGLAGEVFECAAGAAAGEARLTWYPNFSLMSGRYADVEEDGAVLRAYARESGVAPAADAGELDEVVRHLLRGESVAVSQRTLSSVIREHAVDAIDLLKIDVQKSELEVLAGVEEEHWPRIAQVVVEVHDLDGRLARVRELLQRQGFAVEVDKEAALAATPLYQVYARRPAAAAAAAVDDDGGGTDLPAAWGGGARLLRDVEAFAAAHLPEPMRPAFRVLLERLPLTANGKLDRRQLPSPEQIQAGAGAPRIAPRTPVEEVVAEMWRELLGVERLSILDDFFALGGHSLLVTRLVSRIRRTFGVELPLAAVFEAPTVAALAGRIEAARQAGGDLALPDLVAGERPAEVPLSFAQERLWFLEQLEPGSAAYNIAVALRLRGALRPAGLAAALAEIVRRHESLRTVFPQASGGARQEVLAPGGAGLPWVDLGGLGPAAREAEAWRLAVEHGRRVFDLERGPLLRVLGVRLGESEHGVSFAVHHIVADGWSLGVLVRELTALYGALVAGRRSALPELTVQYADYALWQRAWLRGEVLERQVRYWRDQLTGAPWAPLPADRARPAVASHRGGWVELALPVGLGEELRRLARASGATLFMVLLGAWCELLRRLTGERDVRVGTPVAGRTRAETEGLIGFLVNTLVLRLRLEPGWTAGELLERVRAVALAAHAHQDLPFEKLVAELQPQRDLQASPLFQTLLTLQNTGPRALDLPGLDVSLVDLDPRLAKFDLTLAAEDTAEDLVVVLGYSAELFDRATVRRWGGYLAELLAGMAREPGRAVASLPMASAAERQALRCEWNDSGEEYRGWEGACLHQLFERQALRSPQAVAIESASEVVTYGELERRSSSLAARLAGVGIGADEVVGVLIERSVEMVVAILGVLRAGAAYLPLDPAAPQQRLAVVLAEAGGPWVVARSVWRERVEEGGGRPICLADGEETAAAGTVASSSPSPRRALVPASASSLAYVIYTSGSTGRPKGVMVPHAGIVNRVLWVGSHYGMGPGDALLQKTSATFDASVWEVFLPLLSGARLVLAEAGREGDGAYLAQSVSERGITVLQLVPSVLRLLVAERGLERWGLRRLFCGGEALGWDLLERLRERNGVEVVNLYGPTEASIDALSWRCVGEVGEGVVPLGRPLSNVRVEVVDEDLRPVALGVTGELVIGGVGLARGYRGQPCLTAESFVPDASGEEAGGRLYRTGDLGRQRSDGRIEYLGRRDRQVKVRGVRIEPGEVESVVSQHPGVREAAVVAWRETAVSEPLLVAFVVGSGDVVPAAGELREHVRSRLPEAMVPARFVALAALPRLASGKLDRGALPAPVLSPSAGGGEETASAGWLAGLVRGIFEEVLGLESVGFASSFFELGGHSLLATRVMSRLRAACGVELPLRVLFETPTVAGLAERVEEALRRGQVSTAPPLVAQPRGVAQPLSFGQERLWFLDQLDPGSPAYNVVLAVRLAGGLDVAALDRALCEIVRRHQVLRSVFALGAAGPVQWVRDAPATLLATVDVSALARPVGEREVRRVALATGARPFDLAQGPVLRGLALRLGAADHAVVLVLHHVVSDAWSLEILASELSALYGGFAGGRPVALPELAVQYADYAHWQRRALAGPRLEGALSYWRQRLAGAPQALALPTDRPRPARRSAAGGQVDCTPSGGRVEPAARFARGQDATAFAVYLAAFQVLLGRWCNEPDTLVGVPIAGRGTVAVEPLIGFFVNTLVIRAACAGDPTFRQLVVRTRERLFEAYAEQDLPFEKLVEELRPERVRQRTPLVEAVFQQQNQKALRLDLPGLAVDPFAAGPETAKFDLAVTLVENGAAIAGILVYSADLFDRATVLRLASHYQELLAGALAAPDEPLSALTMMSAAERHQTLYEWSGEDAPQPPVEAVHRLFAARAAERPEAVAVVAGDASLTYGELDARADRWARRLLALGVAGAPVGLFLERSLDQVIAILATLKAGSGYVPMDPDYPRERLAFLLRDSGAPVVLTRSALRARLPEEAAARIAELDEWAVPATGAAAAGGRNLELPTHAAGLCYIIYTSGSTGLPKGVLVSHAHVCRLLSATRELYRFGAADVWTLFHSYAFDVSVWELWGALLHGGRLVVVPHAVTRRPEALRDLIATHGVTVLNQTPSAFQTFEHAEAAAPLSPNPLRWVVFAGEALSVARLAPWFARHGDRRPLLVNMYGITETIVHVTHRVIDGADVQAPQRSPIGRPMADLSIHLCDAALRPMAAGLPGEIHVGGAGPAWGYLNRPDLTAARFVPDPFAGKPGARLYRSGDLARRLGDGQLEYLGRIDRQIKVRGFRVELGEIEAALAAHPQIRQAVVLLRQDPLLGPRLVAYVVPAAGAAPGFAEVRRFLAEKLPEPMLPSAVVAVAALPLTAHGKLDLAALPPPAAVRSLATPLVRPRTPLERRLADFYAQALGHEVGVEDDFFRLGGNSIAGALLINELQRQIGAAIPVAAIFDAPSPAAMARFLAGRHDAAVLDRFVAGRTAGATARGAAPSALPRRGRTRFPLSFAQERLWFLHQLQPRSPAYNVLLGLRLSGPLAPRALDLALAELIRRHEPLRTTFAVHGGQPVQEIGGGADMPLVRVDLTGLAAPLRDAELARLSAAAAQRPFDLLCDRPLRSTLLRLAADDHAVLLVLHHIVTDGWSMGILLREAAALYGRFSGHPTEALAELPLQYADFAVWQREWLTGAAMDEQMAYWKQALGEAPRLLDLPLDRPRPALPGWAGAVRPLRFPAPLLDELRQLAQRHGTTLFMVLLAGFQVLLYRLTGQPDVVVGSPIAGRNWPEVEGLIGFFANTLVLRTRLARGMTVERLLAAVAATVRGALHHQDLPFEVLVDELKPARDLSRHPLFQALFVLQNAAAGGAPPPPSGLAIARMPVADGTAKFDLTLALEETDAGLQGGIEHRRELFDGATVERWAGQLGAVLAALAHGDETARLADVALLRGAERQQVAVEWPVAGADPGVADACPCLHEMFSRWSAERPDAVAAVCGAAALSYGALAAGAGRLARRLRQAGMGCGDLVGLCVERSLDLVVGIVGILEAGGAYVPLDPAYPSARLAYMLRDTGARVVVGDGERPAWLAEQPAVAWLEVAAAVHAEAAHEAAVAGAGGRRLPSALPAYVIYTSGSTGEPKGVVVSHRNAVRLLAAASAGMGLGEDETWTLFHSYAFDFSVWELWGALAYGGRLVVVPYEVSRTPAATWRLVVEQGVTVLSQTPSSFAALQRAESAGGAASSRGQALRWVVFGGEALEVDSLAGWFERHGEESPALANLYGITETTVHVTWRRLRRSPPGAVRGSAIGRPLAGWRLYVLDGAGVPSPVGVAGELYVGGAGVARGYLGRPSLTAERFVPDALGGEEGERLYRTGDVGRWLASGEVEYLGRADQQVKVRGFRVELGEIEAALLGCRGVTSAVATALPGPAGGLRLVAYVVGATVGGGPAVEDLRRDLARRLPDHMVPAVFVRLDQLPLTANGKVDRAALPAPGEERPSLAQEYVAPRTPAEKALARIWSQVLGLERVGVEDGFFALGGDSILSLQVVALAAEQGLVLSLADLFRAQTIVELAVVAQPAATADAAGTATGVRDWTPTAPFDLTPAADRAALPADVEDAYPLTLLQAGMLFHRELDPAAAPFHNVDSWHLRGHFEPVAFRQAVAEVVARHAVLRTSFHLGGFSEPLQLVHRRATLAVAVADLRLLPAARQDAAIDALVESEKRRPFAAGEVPLLRLHVALRAADRFQFTLTENHAVWDGWSLHSALTELFQIYFARLAGGRARLAAAPAATFRDFVAMERAAMAAEDCRRYWAAKLADAAGEPLPRFAGAAGRSGEPLRHYSLPVAPQAVYGLRLLSRRAAAPLKSVLLAAHLKVIGLLTGRSAVVTGLVANGRPEAAGSERIAGLFLNNLPFSLRLGEQSWLDLASAAFAAERELLPYRRYPMALLRQHGPPLFETAFNFTSFHVVDAILDSGEIEVLDARRAEGTDLPLLATFSLSGDLLLQLDYDARVLAPAEVAAIGEIYGRALEAMATRPAALHSETALLSAAQLHQVLVEWNDTATRPADETTIPGLFASQAAATPDRIALVEGEEHLTYAGLSRRAARVTRWLRAQGVGQEARVGTSAEPGAELVAGILGILAAGAAYVPVDAAVPAAMRSAVLASAGVSLTLTAATPGGGAETPAAGGPAAIAVPAGAAYVLHTSGSTGARKGVVGLHGATLNRLGWMWERWPFAPGEVSCIKTSVGFVDSVWEILGALLQGVPAVVVPRDAMLDLDCFAGLLQRHGVTRLVLVPSLLRLLLERAGLHRELGALRVCISSGEALSADLAARFAAVLPGTVLLNLYGSTEAAGDVSWRDAAAPRRFAGTLPVGRPIRNGRLVLLDEHGHPARIGVRAALYAGGGVLARGYLDRPELTAAAFVPDPWADQPGGRLYRTGDLARLLPDGEIELLGRADQQVKIRGARVEPAEVETALRRHPAVADAAVVAAVDRAGDACLAAYWVAAGGDAAGVDLRIFLRDRLPAYLIPAVFTRLAEVPRTESGKLDRLALPPPVWEGGGGAAAYQAPRDTTEETLAAIWAEVLGVELVGVEDDFFAAGGHSLAAMRVISRVREAFGIEVELRRLFEHPTVGRLAAWLRQAHGAEIAALDEVLAGLQGLSDDEVREIIRGKEQGP